MMPDGSPEYGHGKHVDPRFHEITKFRGDENLPQMLNTQALNAMLMNEMPEGSMIDE